MGLVQIEESELATLRTERDNARSEVQQAQTEKADAERAVTEAEAKASTAETAKAAAEKERDELKESQRQVAMRDERWGKLGSGFVAKLGDHTKKRLQEAAASVDDAEWDAKLSEVEELASVKRDADAEGGDETAAKGGPSGGGKADGVFENEEVAAFVGSGAGTPPANGATAPAASTRQAVGGLFDAFKK